MKPIAFSRPMVLARRAGRKTQTRRLLQFLPGCCHDVREHTDGRLWPHWIRDGDEQAQPCPYGQPGDRLWVREDFTILTWGRQRSTGSPFCSVHYNADGERGLELPLTEHEYSLLDARQFPYRKTPGRFMYQSLARDKPTLLAVRVERLQDITAADVQAEGVTLLTSPDGKLALPLTGKFRWPDYLPLASGQSKDTCLGLLRTTANWSQTFLDHIWRAHFFALWESIHGPGSAAANPYVWVLTLTPFTAPHS